MLFLLVVLRLMLRVDCVVVVAVTVVVLMLCVAC